MKFGAEPKKMAIFVGLIVVAGVVYWMNSSDAPAPSTTSHTAVDPVAAMSAPVAGNKATKRRVASGSAAGLGDPNWKLPDNVDPTKVDPTVRLDLLAKVQAIGEEGGIRNIFQIGTAPPETKLATAGLNIPGGVPPINPNGPQTKLIPPPTPGPPGPAPPPPPTPITLKYYGYSTKRSDGEKKAFFLDGEDVIVASEGEIIKKQYKVLRISTNSVQMEDTASKSTQTVQIQPEPAPV